jgi:hypothetical protein
MKKENNIDDIFSDGLENFGVQPPEKSKETIAEMRNKIDPEQGGNKKNIFLIIVVAIAIVFVTIFTKSNDEKKLADVKEKFKTKSEASVVDTLKSNSPNTPNTNNSHNESKSIVHDSQSYVQSDVNSTENESTKSKKTQTFKRRMESFKLNNFKDCIAQEISNSDKESNKENSTSGNVDAAVITELIKDKQNEIISTIQPNQTLVTNPDSVVLATVISDSINRKQEEKEIEKEALNSKPVSQVDSTKNKKRIKWFVEPCAGIYNAKNNFPNSNTISLTQLKDSFIMSQPLYTYGVNVGVEKNHFSVKVGVGLLQWKEQLGYSYAEQKYVTTMGDSIIINGTDTIVKHNIPVQVLTDVHQLNNNKTAYTYLQIPVFIAYEVPFKKINFNAGVGIIFNQLVASKGNYKNYENDKIVDYSTKKDALLRNSFFTAQASVGAGYEISKRMKVGFTVPVNVGVSSIYRANYTVNRKIQFTGVQIGLKYLFN